MNDGWNVLIVEDNPAHAEQVERALRDIPGPAPHTHIEASLHGAIESSDKERYDVAIVDLGLRDSAGMDTLRGFHAAHPETPIIAVTSTADEQHVEEAMHAGAQDFLTKREVGAITLDRAVRRALGRHALWMEERRRTDEEIKGLMELARDRHQTDRPTGPPQSLSPAQVDEFAALFTKAVTTTVQNAPFQARSSESGHLHLLAARLANANAGPAAVTSIFSTAVRHSSEGRSPEAQQSYYREARLAMIHLLGLLVDEYRARATTVQREVHQA